MGGLYLPPSSRSPMGTRFLASLPPKMGYQLAQRAGGQHSQRELALQGDGWVQGEVMSISFQDKFSALLILLRSAGKSKQAFSQAAQHGGLPYSNTARIDRLGWTELPGPASQGAPWPPAHNFPPAETRRARPLLWQTPESQSP